MFNSLISGFIVSQLGFIALGVNPTCSIWQLYRTGQGPGSTAALRMWGRISGSSHQLWEQSRSPCRGHPPAFHSGGWASPSFSVWWKTCRASLISLIAAISQKVGVYSGIGAGGDALLAQISKATPQADYDGLINHYLEVKLSPSGLFSLNLSFNGKVFSKVPMTALIHYINTSNETSRGSKTKQWKKKSKVPTKLDNLNTTLHNSVNMSVKYMTQICADVLPIPKSCTAAALYILHICCVSHAAYIQTLGMRWCILEFWVELVCLYNIYNSDDEW